MERKKRGRPPKHGVYSATALMPITDTKRELVLGVLTGDRLMITDADRIAVDLLARNLAKIELMDRWLQEHSLFTNDDLPQPVLKVYWLALNSAARLCGDLGLTPASRVRLGVQLSGVKDLATAMSEARGM